MSVSDKAVQSKEVQDKIEQQKFSEFFKRLLKTNYLQIKRRSNFKYQVK